MKPFLSFCVILILFQSLVLGSLVKLELPALYTQNWEETRIDKQIVLDPFLLPGKDGYDQSQQNKDEWTPFNYNTISFARNNSGLPEYISLTITRNNKLNYSDIPVYILTRTLRI